MRRLRERHHMDGLTNQPRAQRQRIIRWLYLASLTGLVVWLGNLFFGDLFYFRSQGLVLSDAAVVAAEFPVTVREVSVREGDRVAAGTVAAVVSSQSAVESIARLTAELASRQARISDLRVRRQIIDAIIGAAENRQDVAISTRSEYEKAMKQGYLPLDKRTAVVESEFRSRQDFESLSAERRVIDSELETLNHAFAQAESALADLRRLYANGRMRVPIDGVVGRIAADQGAVVRPGDPLIEVYGNKRYVLAYLPTGALYNVNRGDRVRIETGLVTTEGRVTRVQPFANALPREFQRAFSPVDRRQVIRVEFSSDQTQLPLFSKVTLHAFNIFPTVAKLMDWSSPVKRALAESDLRKSLR
jgi:multidrug resistance efflux pump